LITGKFIKIGILEEITKITDIFKNAIYFYLKYKNVTPIMKIKKHLSNTAKQKKYLYMYRTLDLLKFEPTFKYQSL